MTDADIEGHIPNEADGQLNIWWVIDGADPDEKAQIGGFTCLTDNRRIRIARTPGTTGQAGILEDLRGLGASEDLIESLRWLLSVADSGDEITKDLVKIRAITIYSSGGALL